MFTVANILFILGFRRVANLMVLTMSRNNFTLEGLFQLDFWDFIARHISSSELDRLSY